MKAYMAMLNASGIDSTTTSTYELNAEIKPGKSGDNLVAPTGTAGDKHFAVQGPCTTEPYRRWLDVNSYGFDVRHSSVAGSAAFTAFLQPSIVSPQLIESCAKNISYAYVRCEIFLGTTDTFKRLVVTMKTATIVSFRNYSGDISGPGLTSSGHIESYAIQFKECEWGHVEDGGTSQQARRWTIG